MPTTLIRESLNSMILSRDAVVLISVSFSRRPERKKMGESGKNALYVIELRSHKVTRYDGKRTRRSTQGKVVACGLGKIVE
jgi:hypothetical protein